MVSSWTRLLLRAMYGSMFLLLLGIFVIASIVLCLRSLQQMELQMNECLSAMDKSISDNYQTRIPVTGNNEISHICRRINLLLTQAADTPWAFVMSMPVWNYTSAEKAILPSQVFPGWKPA